MIHTIKPEPAKRCMFSVCPASARLPLQSRALDLTPKRRKGPWSEVKRVELSRAEDGNQASRSGLEREGESSKQSRGRARSHGASTIRCFLHYSSGAIDPWQPFFFFAASNFRGNTGSALLFGTARLTKVKNTLTSKPIPPDMEEKVRNPQAAGVPRKE